MFNDKVREYRTARGGQDTLAWEGRVK